MVPPDERLDEAVASGTLEVTEVRGTLHALRVVNRWERSVLPLYGEGLAGGSRGREGLRGTAAARGA